MVGKLRGVPAGLPSVEEVRTMLAADPDLKCVVSYARISFDGRVKDAQEFAAAGNRVYLPLAD
ncbi:hypothetical protein ACGFYV_11515 [Streptomyces sp. NPDC048297]|uniref:hypothetical protein n=1 Tax=Streptomyces sp. NPDC048297 TaxID=3365531 RepID=UPI0037186D87